MWILAFFGYLSQVVSNYTDAASSNKSNKGYFHSYVNNVDTNVFTFVQNGDVIVNLANGQVRGIQSVTDTCNTDVCNTEHPYYAFKGMRYAQPPERFKRSVAVKPWTGIYDATRDRASCIQVPISNQQESEDCLYINVYTPTLPSKSNVSLAVMVWIYGGTFIFGDSSYATYGPDHFLLENVIIVSLNYRLGLFGFMSTGNDLLPGNDGIKDLVLGLHWIKENIHAFNGDPNNILLFGESAGAALISYLIQSPLTKNLGLISKAIYQSGSALYPWTLQRNPEKIFWNVVSRTPCIIFGITNQALNCLKLLDIFLLRIASTITYNIDSVNDFGIFNGVPFAPVLEDDIPTSAITGNTYEMLSNGKFPKHVTLMLGATSEEGLIISSMLPILRLLLLQIDLNRKLIIPKDMYVSDGNISFVAETLFNYYFPNISIIISLDQDIIRYISDSMFNKPWREHFTLIQNEIENYCYIISYYGPLSGVTKTYSGLEKVAHGAELNYFWKNVYTKSAKFPANDLLTRSRLIRLWTNFAKYSNPTPVRDTILQNITWPKSSLGGTNINCMNVGNNLEIINNPKENQYRMWKELYTKYGNPRDTY